MKFLLDAQLPPSLKKLFTDNGFDCMHTNELELGNDTPDKIINQVSLADKRILITKDSDFFDSFIVKSEPYKLIMVKLGNTSKQELVKFFHDHFSEIIERIEIEDMILLRKEN